MCYTLAVFVSRTVRAPPLFVCVLSLLIVEWVQKQLSFHATSGGEMRAGRLETVQKDQM